MSADNDKEGISRRDVVFRVLPWSVAVIGFTGLGLISSRASLETSKEIPSPKRIPTPPPDSPSTPEPQPNPDYSETFREVISVQRVPTPPEKLTETRTPR